MSNYPRSTRRTGHKLVTEFRAAGHLAENPNRGKRHTTPAGAHYRETSSQVRHGETLYSPLTVHTPIMRARKSPRTTSYTI